MRAEIEQFTLIVNLLKQDRFGMRFSMEGRVPLVGRRILEYAAGMPVNRIVSHINKEILLAYSRSRPLHKRAFSVLESPAYRRLLPELFAKYAGPRDVAECGLLDPATVERVGRESEGDGILAAKRAMAVVVFMIWWREYRGQLKP